MLEQMLVRHCAPTLAGIKTGNLFHYRIRESSGFEEEFEGLRRALNPSGVCIRMLKRSQEMVLILVYRSTFLQRDLEREETQMFMKKLGYDAEESVEAHISVLVSRFSCLDEFPHEIGLFLGYPLEDVIGFIVNKGKNCKYCGVWKVYCDECKAKKLFYQYQQCVEQYQRLIKNGTSLRQLIEAAGGRHLRRRLPYADNTQFIKNRTKWGGEEYGIQYDCQAD